MLVGQKCEQPGQNGEIGRHVSGETPVLAGVAETAASDIEAADSGGDGCDNEDQDQRGQDRQCTAIEESEDQRDATENFQPGQIKRDRDRNRPRKNFVIIDVAGEANRVEHFEYAGINENSADDKIDDAPKDV